MGIDQHGWWWWRIINQTFSSKVKETTSLHGPRRRKNDLSWLIRLSQMIQAPINAGSIVTTAQAVGQCVWLLNSIRQGWFLICCCSLLIMSIFQGDTSFEIDRAHIEICVWPRQGVSVSGEWVWERGLHKNETHDTVIIYSWMNSLIIPLWIFRHFLMAVLQLAIAGFLAWRVLTQSRSVTTTKNRSRCGLLASIMFVWRVFYKDFGYFLSNNGGNDLDTMAVIHSAEGEKTKCRACA